MAFYLPYINESAPWIL